MERPCINSTSSADPLLLSALAELGSISPDVSAIHDQNSLSRIDHGDHSSEVERAESPCLEKSTIASLNQKKTKWYRQWWIELSALGFGLACVTANVAILCALNGKPYGGWKVVSADITPNTLVPIISTLS
jgi:hypothetical protein